MTKKRKRASRRWRRLRSLGTGGLVVAAMVVLAVLAVYGARGGGGGGEFVPEIVEEPSESHGAGPFTGGPRLHFPVGSVDLGQVPLNTEVSYAFALSNLGDAVLRIEDVQVKMLEGC